MNDLSSAFFADELLVERVIWLDIWEFIQANVLTIANRAESASLGLTTYQNIWRPTSIILKASNNAEI